jgi:hypothetical protein
MLRLICFLITVLALSACSQPRIKDHAAFEPTVQLAEFFSGDLNAYGVVRDRSGTVIRTFSADIAASSDAGVVTLDEDFVFDNGDQDKRVWTLTPKTDGSWGGTAGDVVGEGKLLHSGNALFLDYVLRIPYNDGTIDVSVDDRMYQVAPNILLNESIMTKFGIQVGSILLVIVKQP